MRVHRKVYLWWGKWWAVQLTLLHDGEISCGVRLNYLRPMIDFYLGPLTIAIGRHAVYTDPRTRHWDSCRGMLFTGDTDPRVL